MIEIDADAILKRTIDLVGGEEPLTSWMMVEVDQGQGGTTTMIEGDLLLGVTMIMAEVVVLEAVDMVMI